MRTLLAALAALVLALAGCSSPDDGGGDGTTTPPPTTTGPAPTTTTGPAPTTTTGPAPTTTPPAENTAPTATLSATTEEGTFNVTFSVDGADEDGDELTWTLDVDDDGEADYEGEELPDEVVHTYAAAGNYTAVLTVSDGMDEGAADVDVAVTAAGGAGQTVNGTWDATSTNCPGASSSALPASVYFPAQLEGIAFASFEVAPETIGGSFSVDYVLADDSVGGIVFADADDAIILRVITGDPQGATHIEEVVPDSAATAYMFSCLSEPDSVTADYASPAVPAA